MIIAENIAAGIPQAAQAACAGDDAAGLAISEKMRAQITGLERATNNAQDGISLVQTAEGALTEVHSMLNRMVDLATQASNGTYDNDVDRLNLEKEVVALKEEINRVASSTNFNGIKLLNGELGAAGKVSTTPGTNAVIAPGALSGTATTANVSGIDLSGATVAEGATGVTYAATAVDAASPTLTAAISGKDFTFDLKTENETYNDYTIEVVLTKSAGAASNTGTIDTSDKKITLTLDSGSGAEISAAFSTADAMKTALAGALQAAVDGEGTTLFGSAAVTAAADGSFTAPTAGKVTLSGKTAGGIAADTKLDITVSDATTSWTAQIAKADYAAGSKVTLTAAGKGNVVVTFDDEPAAAASASAMNLTVTAATGAVTTIDFTGKTGAQAIGTTIEIGGTKYEFVKTAGDEAAGNTGIVLAENADADAIANALQTAIAGKVAGHAATKGTGADAGKVLITSDATGTAAAAAEVTLTGAGLRLQIGDTADQAVSVAVGDMSATALGLDGVSVASEKGAADSIALIKNAINTVSGTRADLGAIQNRLEHTVNNLTTTTENMTNAESRIRDTDMAKEMMAFTKNNVLAQAAQSMLAQANQQPQQVLQLLR